MRHHTRRRDQLLFADPPSTPPEHLAQHHAPCRPATASAPEPDPDECEDEYSWRDCGVNIAVGFTIGWFIGSVPTDWFDLITGSPPPPLAAVAPDWDDDDDDLDEQPLALFDGPFAPSFGAIASRDEAD